jgi:alkylation response protein AidB-like acyl-CoA dehydrogenase
MDIAALVTRAMAAGRTAAGSTLQAETVLRCVAPDAVGIAVTGGIAATADGTLSGTAPAALWHGGKAYVHVIAADRCFTVAAGRPGVEVADADSLDGLPAVAVTLRGVTADASVPLDLAPARIAMAAEMAGAAHAALDLALERARSRRIFGKPIGTFQALAHRLADAFIDVEAMDLALQEAAAEGGAGDGRALKALCGEAARRTVATAQQVWSGEGYHADQALPAFTRRVLGLSLRLGAPDDDYRSLARRTP